LQGTQGVFGGEILEPKDALRASPALRLLTESGRLAIVPFRIRLH
jgi:hypothetical protein